MKKTAVFGLLFFLFFSQISVVSAEENPAKINKEEISFIGKVLYYHGSNQEIDFVYLNPQFFNDNKSYSLSYYLFIDQIKNSQNSSAQNKRAAQSAAQENNWGLFLLRVFAESFAAIYGGQNKVVY